MEIITEKKRFQEMEQILFNRVWPRYTKITMTVYDEGKIEKYYYETENINGEWLVKTK